MNVLFIRIHGWNCANAHNSGHLAIRSFRAQELCENPLSPADNL